MSKLKIILADDHAIVREGLRLLVSNQPDMEVIAEADNGRVVLQMCKEINPDIVLMDISMPEMNGAKTTERLKQLYPQIKILILTAHEDKAYLNQLLKAGASGYVLKRTASDDLIYSIRAVAEGGVYIDPVLANKVVNTYIRKQLGKGSGNPNDLSEREAEVLRQIALGYSNKEIANQLDISVKTVETYKTRLMTKLDLHSRAEIVRYAIYQGWLQE
jgi:DNA-binding NarL/FixJ family response regulator